VVLGQSLTDFQVLVDFQIMQGHNKITAGFQLHGVLVIFADLGQSLTDFQVLKCLHLIFMALVQSLTDPQQRGYHQICTTPGQQI